MATSWEEVKRLAADFQRAQLTSSVQRLSDRNCIEIVKKLISMKLIDVVFTTSGKEYITPQHLHKEIKVIVPEQFTIVCKIGIQPFKVR